LGEQSSSKGNADVFGGAALTFLIVGKFQELKKIVYYENAGAKTSKETALT